MDYKKKIYKHIISSIIIVLIGYALVDLISFEFSSCGFGYNGPTVSESGETIFTPSCGDIRGYLEDADENIGMPLMIFFIPIIALLFIFIFVREEIFNAWFGFSKVLIPVIMSFSMFLPDHDDMFFHFDQINRSVVLSALFVFGTLTYITTAIFKPNWDFWKVFIGISVIILCSILL